MNRYTDAQAAARGLEFNATQPQEKLRQPIPSASGEEPVAWQWRRKGEPWTREQTWTHEVFATTDNSEVRSLYASPVARQPLTEEEIDAAWYSMPCSPGDGWLKPFARAIERAHGIHSQETKE